MKDLTEGKPGKLILAFALPIALGNIFQLCYSFADVWIVGNILGNNALAAVGSTSTLNDLIVGFLIGLTNGFAVITAQCFGAKKYEDMRQAVAHTLTLGLAVSIILTVFSTVFLIPILHALNIPDEHFSSAFAYSKIILLGMTFSMIYNICASVLRAVGDAVTPLIFLIISAVLNIILDFVLIKYTDFGVAGAAYATVISQIISAALCIVYIAVKYPMLRLKKQNFVFSAAVSKQLMSCGMSMGLMNSLVAFGTVALQSSINTFGTNIIVAHTAARKLTNFFMMPLGVLGMTMAAYCAQNYGAEKYSRIRSGVFKAVLYCWIWCAGLIVLIFTCAPAMLRMITSTDVAEIIDTGTLYLRINCILYCVTAVISVFRNSLQGVGVHKTPIVSSGIELVGKVAIVMFLAPKIGYMGIILSEPIVWVVMVIPLIIRLMRHPAMAKSSAA
ncbi:MAG: MATE family efflux transporter [Oscillospiraceae bacterium]|nr:MATE family efflux transporter [Oscillospiraceae bacterium]